MHYKSFVLEICFAGGGESGGPEEDKALAESTEEGRVTDCYTKHQQCLLLLSYKTNNFSKD